METYYFNVVETSGGGAPTLLYPHPAEYTTGLGPQEFAEQILKQRQDPATRTDPVPPKIVVNVWKSEPDPEAGQAPDAIAEWSADE